MPVAGPLIGAGASLIGSSMGLSAQKKAGRQMWDRGQYKPYGLDLPGGNVNFNNGHASGALSPDYAGIRNNLLGLTNYGLGAFGSSTGGYQGVPQSLYDEFLRSQNGVLPTQYTNPAMYGGLLSQYGSMAGNLAGQVGQPTGLEGLLSQYGSAATGAYNQLASADPNKLFQDRYGLLQSLDAQRQQRLMGANFDSQFGKGILSSTAGQYQTQGLMDSFNQQATQNQLTAQDYASQQYQNNIGNLLGLGSGFQGALGASQGIDMNRLTAALSGLQGYQGLDQTAYGRSSDAANLTNALTQQRFGNAQNLFGLGQQGANQSLAAASMGLQGVGGIDSYLANLIGLGGNLGSAQSAANVAASGGNMQAAGTQANMLANAFGGLGSGLANINWGNMMKTTQPIYGTAVPGGDGGSYG